MQKYIKIRNFSSPRLQTAEFVFSSDFRVPSGKLLRYTQIRHRLRRKNTTMLLLGPRHECAEVQSTVSAKFSYVFLSDREHPLFSARPSPSERYFLMRYCGACSLSLSPAPDRFSIYCRGNLSVMLGNNRLSTQGFRE